MDKIALNRKLKKMLIEQKKRIITVCIAVFVWGMLAHSYGLLNLTISHDSLCEFFLSMGDAMHKVELGRFMVPIYQLVFHGRVTLPWLNGLLSLCWLSISTLMIIHLFSITEKIQIILIAGILTVNITVTALTATYIHDLDADMFAVMLAVYATCLWNKGGKSTLASIPILVMMLGFYQSMLSVTISLIMFISIMALLQGDNIKTVLFKGIQAIGTMLIAGILYIILAKFVCIMLNTKLSSAYNGITNLFVSKGGVVAYIYLILKAYLKWLVVFSRSSRSLLCMILLHSLLALPSITVIISAMKKKTLSKSNKLLILCLSALLPLGMNISYVLDGGMAHDLMLYSAWLIYLLAILLINWFKDSCDGAKVMKKLCNFLTVIILFAILITDVQTANSAYVKKDLERQATLSIMTEVDYEMNKIDNYIAGETNVVFIGIPQVGINELFPYMTHITGLQHKSPVSYFEYYSPYYHYILQKPLAQSKKDIPKTFIDPIPAFPNEGYIQWYDDILVVKMSEDY